MEIWSKIVEKLRNHKRIILLLVCSHKGSSPGKQGFKMMVCEDGTLYGSIGGGRTEFQMVEKAKVLLQKDDFKPFLINQVHREDAEDSSGMVCAGEQLVLFYPIDSENLSTIKDIVLQKKGVLKITKDEFVFDEKAILKDDFIFEKYEEWNYAENVNRKSKIFLIGGGHVGLATSQLFSLLDFEITVFENRENINTFENNSFADNKLLVDYNNIVDYIPEGNNTYIVILTHGHQVDKLVLSKLFKKDYKYIGLLGSKSKVRKMFNAFAKEGIDKEELAKVDAPVGLDIGSKTPAEIAVSIAAKIIAMRNKGNLISLTNLIR